MKGKQKCNILREIRRKIAAENGIPFRSKDCTHTGECSGTCPYCESEVRYLEEQLKKKASLGKQIRIAAVCAGMTAVVSGCTIVDKVAQQFAPSPTPEIVELSGEVPWPYETEAPGNEDEINGKTGDPVPTEEAEKQETISVPVPESGTETVQIEVNELSGYVPYIP